MARNDQKYLLDGKKNIFFINCNVHCVKLTLTTFIPTRLIIKVRLTSHWLWEQAVWFSALQPHFIIKAICHLASYLAEPHFPPGESSSSRFRQRNSAQHQLTLGLGPQVNSVSAREQLAQSIRDLTAALAERHASLTQALEAARQKRGEALAAQVSERRSLMEHAGLMAFTQELLKETDQPCFVQAARLTHNRSLLSYFCRQAYHY